MSTTEKLPHTPHAPHAIQGQSKANAAAASAGQPPIIVDMGKKSRKEIRKLRRGRPGKLLDNVEETMAHLRENGELGADTQAVVFVVRQRAGGGNKIARLWGIR